MIHIRMNWLLLQPLSPSTDYAKNEAIYNTPASARLADLGTFIMMYCTVSLLIITMAFSPIKKGKELFKQRNCPANTDGSNVTNYSLLRYSEDWVFVMPITGLTCRRVGDPILNVLSDYLNKANGDWVEKQRILSNWRMSYNQLMIMLQRDYKARHDKLNWLLPRQTGNGEKSTLWV